MDAVDSLYVRVGTISADRYSSRPGQPQQEVRWNAWGQLPQDLPDAREYWLVFRYESQGVPDEKALESLGDRVADLAFEARKRRLNVVGLQLDIDSPTRLLADYAKFLAGVRKELPQGYRLSITALLDWFRSGTSIASVIEQVDEFVPQFYDTGVAGAVEPAIAARIDATQWGTTFRRYRKPFRIGISTFGRARQAGNSSGSSAGYFYGRDLAPLDLATNPNFRPGASQNKAGELVLTYRAIRKTQLSYMKFEPGEGIEFVLATAASVQPAVQAARRTGAAGVIFFRWPDANEKLSMQPGEALAAAGETRGKPESPRILQADGGCAAVECADLYLGGAAPFSPNSLRYRIHTSAPLEYFLPDGKMPIRMTGDSELELTLPPYCGRGRLLLGRAVSARKAEFQIAEVTQ